MLKGLGYWHERITRRTEDGGRHHPDDSRECVCGSRGGTGLDCVDVAGGRVVLVEVGGQHETF